MALYGPFNFDARTYVFRHTYLCKHMTAYRSVTIEIQSYHFVLIRLHVMIACDARFDRPPPALFILAILWSS